MAERSNPQAVPAIEATFQRPMAAMHEFFDRRGETLVEAGGAWHLSSGGAIPLEPPEAERRLRLEVLRLRAELDAAVAVAVDAEALALLREVESEGVGDWGMQYRGCPVCGGAAREVYRSFADGVTAVAHATDCRLAAFLCRYGGVLQERRATARRQRIEERRLGKAVVRG